MELGTFGAILSFALEFEGNITRFFEAAAGKAGKGEAGDLFAELAEAGEKRLKVLERTRRENVAEMILEPISGFCSEEYPCETAISAAASAPDLVKQATGLETTAEAYYGAASGKVTVPEVARILKKIAKQHADQKVMLEELA